MEAVKTLISIEVKTSEETY